MPSEKRGFYEVFSYGDSLSPGDKLKIEHTISSRDDGTQLSKWTHLPVAKLEVHRKDSAAKEKKIFEKLCGAVKEWEEQAAQTMLLDDAIEYVNTGPVKHTSNEWAINEFGSFECSNMVYKMTYQIREETQFNRDTKKHEPAGWLVSWDVRYNFPEHARGGGHIAGQERKKFTSKEKMDNYIIGRIVAHAHHFTTLSPPVPQNLAWKFSRNHQLLPGYTVEQPEPAVPDKTPPRQEKDTGGTDYSRFTNKKPKKDSPTKKAGPAR